MSQVPLKSVLDKTEKIFKEYVLEGMDSPMLTKDGLKKLMKEQLPNLTQVRRDKVGCWEERIGFLA